MGSTSKPLPQLDLCHGTEAEPFLGLQAGSWSEQSEGFEPIGRETEIERPPCRSTSAE